MQSTSLNVFAQGTAPPGSLGAYAALAGQAMPALAARMDAGLRQAFCEARFTARQCGFKPSVLIAASSLIPVVTTSPASRSNQDWPPKLCAATTYHGRHGRCAEQRRGHRMRSLCLIAWYVQARFRPTAWTECVKG